MKTEQEQLTGKSKAVSQVFPQEFLSTLAPQQINQINHAIHRVVMKSGEEAVTVDRLEGIKELVTQHLWSPALTAQSQRLRDSQS